MKKMLADAAAGGYAVGYFESWDQYSLEAVIEAAEEANSPVIVGFGGVMMNQEWFGRTGLRALAAMGRTMAEEAQVPVSFLLNEVLSFDHIRQGIAGGFNAVMLDTSHLPFEENVSETRRVVEAASLVGIDVEGECDPLPDASGTMGEHSGSKVTDPQAAAEFVKATGVCALSVAVGNEHIRADGTSAIDMGLLAQIHEAVPVPLVIHGGTGFPDDAVAEAIQWGVAKFNVGSVLKKLYIESIRSLAQSLPTDMDVHAVVGSHKAEDILEKAKNAVKAEVARRMAVYGSKGKA
jgi:fructose-bisphosphate aldolase class II